MGEGGGHTRGQTKAAWPPRTHASMPCGRAPLRALALPWLPLHPIWDTMPSGAAQPTTGSLAPCRGSAVSATGSPGGPRPAVLWCPSCSAGWWFSGLSLFSAPLSAGHVFRVAQRSGQAPQGPRLPTQPHVPPSVIRGDFSCCFCLELQVHAVRRVC